MGISDNDWLTTTLDCGDSSCLFRDRDKPGGMRTNGGCRCMSGLHGTARVFVNKMYHKLTTKNDINDINDKTNGKMSKKY